MVGFEDEWWDSKGGGKEGTPKAATQTGRQTRAKSGRPPPPALETRMGGRKSGAHVAAGDDVGGTIIAEALLCDQGGRLGLSERRGGGREEQGRDDDERD